MQTIFATCHPRQDVLDGNWTDDTFAAKLHTVHAGTAPPTYYDPQRFFANTYPTVGLRDLLRDSLGRLSGKDRTANPVIRLETAFGGGKTHNLIALYHLAKLGQAAKSIAGLEQFVSPDLLPQEPVRTAVLVGQVLDVAQGMEHPEDGIVTRTLWGELAYQIGGKTGYEAVAESDRRGIAPGMDALEKALGSGPVLIIMDELALYLRKAGAAGVGDANLGGQTVAFLHTLTELVATRPQTSLVLTLADKVNAYAEETEQLAFSKMVTEAGDVVARSERVIIPAREEELAPILRRRLFEQVDMEAGRKVAESYVAHYREGFEKGARLPEEVLSSEYLEQIARAYPFHPDLIRTLDQKVATIAEFQKTRGALRLLAAMVRHLWNSRPSDAYLIQSHHVDLSVERIQGDLTGRIGRAEYLPVIRADIFMEDGSAHSQKLDARQFAPLGFPNLVRRVAQTVYLHTLVRTVQPGLSSQELLLSCAQPGLPFDVLQKAIDALSDTAWYMATDGTRYWFQVEPSINKVIQDEVNLVSPSQAKQRVRDELKTYYSGSTLHLKPFPKQPGDVEDKPAYAQMVLIDFDDEKVSGTAPEAPPLVQRIFAYKGQTGVESYRQYKNTLFFLVADAERYDAMVHAAQVALALENLANNKERMAAFKDQQKTVLARKDMAAIQLRIAITSCYRHLYFADPHAGTFAFSPSGLGHHLLSPADHSDTPKNMEPVLIKVLQDLKKLHEPGTTLAPLLLVQKLWGAAEAQMSTQAFYHRFSERSSLPLVLHPGEAKQMIIRGCQEKVWVYDDGHNLYVNHPPHFRAPQQVSIDGYCQVILFAEAEKAGRLKPPVCPTCGQFPCACQPSDGGKKVLACPICGQVECVCSKPPVDPLDRLLPVEDLVNAAFERFRDQMVENSVESVPGVQVTTSSVANVCMGLRLLPTIAPLGPRYELSWSQEAPGQGTVRLEVEGNWDVLREAKAALESFPAGQEWEEAAHLVIRVAFNPPAAADDDRLAQVQKALATLPDRVRLELWRG